MAHWQDRDWASMGGIRDARPAEPAEPEIEEASSEASDQTGPESPEPQPDENREPYNLAAMLCYFLGWPSALPCYLLSKNDPYLRYHALQAMAIDTVILLALGAGLAAYWAWRSMVSLFTMLLPAAAFYTVMTLLLVSVCWGGLFVASLVIRVVMIFKSFHGQTVRLAYIEKLCDYLARKA